MQIKKIEIRGDIVKQIRKDEDVELTPSFSATIVT